MNDDHVALTRCFFCGGSNNILLATRYHQTSNHIMVPDHSLKTYHDKVIDLEPCPKCQDYMEQGIILITINDERSDEGWEKQHIPNPFRVGGFFVVTEAAIRRLLDGSMLEWCLKHRWIFIDYKAAEQIGLTHERKDTHEDK